MLIDKLVLIDKLDVDR